MVLNLQSLSSMPSRRSTSSMSSTLRVLLLLTGSLLMKSAYWSWIIGLHRCPLPRTVDSSPPESYHPDNQLGLQDSYGDVPWQKTFSPGFFFPVLTANCPQVSGLWGEEADHGSHMAPEVTDPVHNFSLKIAYPPCSFDCLLPFFLALRVDQHSDFMWPINPTMGQQIITEDTLIDPESPTDGRAASEAATVSRLMMGKEGIIYSEKSGCVYTMGLRIRTRWTTAHKIYVIIIFLHHLWWGKNFFSESSASYHHLW